MSVFVVMYYVNIDDGYPDAVFSTRSLAEQYVERSSDPERHVVVECGDIDSQAGGVL